MYDLKTIVNTFVDIIRAKVFFQERNFLQLFEMLNIHTLTGVYFRDIKKLVNEIDWQ